METDRISEADRVERAGLEGAVADIERQMREFPIGMRPFFSATLLNAKARIGVLDQKIQEADRERQEHNQEEAAIVTLALSETRLSASEKETYSGFLKKDFFTRKDFGALDQFYAKTWDRLSEHGKDEMSHRVWEGVRKKEYNFDDLPTNVREKETERAYQVLKQRQPAQGANAEITEHDRSDFIRAYETGDRQGASKILGRDSFKETMYRGKESAALSHEATQISRPTDATALVSRADKGMAEATEKKTSEAGKGANADASLLGLGGVKLVDTPTQGSSADLPIAKTNTAQQSTRGCRISEALSLRSDSLDSDMDVIRIQSLKKRGRKEIRRVPVPEFMATELRNLPTADGHQRFWQFSRTNGWRIIKRVMSAAGISGIHATTKGLRHGFGVRGVLQQIPVSLIQNWMGHADSSTTAIYLAVRDEEERLLIEKTW